MFLKLTLYIIYMWGKTFRNPRAWIKNLFTQPRVAFYPRLNPSKG